MNIKKIIWKISILIPESKLKEKIRDIIYIDLLKKNIYFLLKKNKLLIGLKNKEKIKVLLKKESVMHDYNSISGYLKEYIPNKGEVVVDAGAYDGTISLIFSKLVKEKGKVIAFEPDPINFNKLVQKIKNNRLKNIIPINKALYSKNGMFKLNNLGTESSKLSSKNNEKKKTPLISIIMPVYNPEFSDLNKAILSCINQTYQSWELCICDDCSTKPYVKPLIKKFISKDKRIKAVFSEKNEHISAASNKVLSLAKGDYIGFLDHDDELDKKALEEIAKSIKENNPDMIYTDEAVLNKNNLKEPIFKPDFSPENLMSCNYIVHFVVVKKEIIKKIKGFEIGTEGAQDYDLVLKISEITKNIIHISKILYYWRKSKHSILNNINNKPYVINAGKKVLEHALKRRKIQGDVEITKNFGIYKVNYKIINNPKV